MSKKARQAKKQRRKMLLDWHQNINNFKKELDRLKDQLFKDALIPAKAFENIENRTSVSGQ